MLAWLSPEQAAAVERAEGPTVVSAGAGTGKTTTMAARYVHTAMARIEAHEGRVRRALERVAAVTFTELAAAELRERIARVFLEVASELEGERAGWAREAASLGGDLPIGTIHGLCARLLRTATVAEGLPSPDFEVLDELGAELLWRRAVEDALDSLSIREPERVARLLADRGEARRLRAVVRSLGRRLSPAELAAVASRSERELRDEADRAAVELLHRVAGQRAIASAVQEARARALSLRRVVGAGLQKTLDPLLRWTSGTGSAALARMPVASCGATDARLARLDPRDGEALIALSEAVRAFKKVADPVAKALAPEALALEHRWVGDLTTLALAAREAYEADKRARDALDFDDLERAALAMLQAEGDVPARFDAILVDELQDTSRMQLAILQALDGERCPRVFGVGDPKQSIYRFRDADVSVFASLAGRAPGGPLELRVNRRSTAPVLAFVNALFSRVFPAETPPERPWEAPMQRLEAARDAVPDALPGVVIVPFSALDEDGEPLPAAALRARDAAVTARAVERAAARLGSPEGVAVLLRAVRGDKRAYADAIDTRGLPVAVEASGTFVTDAAAALGLALVRALALPGHESAWLAVLRSPMIGLDEASLRRLADHPRRDKVTMPARVRELAEAEPLLLGARRPLLLALAWAAESPESLSDRFSAVLAACGVASRQLDKLVARLEDMERRGLGPLEVVEVLEALAADDRERRVPDPALAGRVRALTVHAAKGLEFPAACVPQLGTPRVGSSFVLPDAVRVGDVFRVAPTLPAGKPSVLREANRWLETAREDAEQARLQYVAFTRARDHLILPLPIGLPEDAAGTMAEPLVPMLAGLDLEAEGTRELDLGEDGRIAIEVWPDLADGEDAATDAARHVELRRRQRSAPSALDGPATWSVTRLSSLAFCPAYHAQAPVAPWPDPPGPPPEEATGPLSGAERGTLVHRWLERVQSAADVMIAPLPPGLEGEGERLRARLATIVADPELGPLFDSGTVRCELDLELERDGLVVAGSLDRVILAPQGDGRITATVVEYKTGRTGHPGPRGRNPSYFEAYRFQLAAYAAMLRGWLGDRLVGAVRGRVAFIDLGEVVVCDHEPAAAEHELDRVLAEIRAPYTLPLRLDACPQCRMAAFCPVSSLPQPEPPAP